MAHPHPLPLPVVEVSSLDDVEKLATHGGPRRIIVLRAESLDEARAMLSVLRAKGLLGDPHGGDLDGFDTGSGDSDAEGGAGADEGSDDGARQFEGGSHDLGPLGWISDPEILDRLLVSDDDTLYAGSDGAGAYHGGDDVIADGWAIDPLDRLLRADDLGRMLDEIAADTLRRLLKDATDSDVLRRLRILGRDIRRIGKEMPGLMGQPPVTLGNYIQNVVTQALKRGGSGRRAWVDERRGRILARVFALCHD